MVRQLMSDHLTLLNWEAHRANIPSDYPLPRGYRGVHSLLPFFRTFHELPTDDITAFTR